jgi:hypothetical protein
MGGLNGVSATWRFGISRRLLGFEARRFPFDQGAMKKHPLNRAETAIGGLLVGPEGTKKPSLAAVPHTASSEITAVDRASSEGNGKAPFPLNLGLAEFAPSAYMWHTWS